MTRSAGPSFAHDLVMALGFMRALPGERKTLLSRGATRLRRLLCLRLGYCLCCGDRLRDRSDKLCPGCWYEQHVMGVYDERTAK